MHESSPPREHAVPRWQSAIVLLSRTVTASAVMVTLSWGRAILVPIAVAGLLTFLLNPIVGLLRRGGLPRVWSVLLAVSITGGVLTVVGTMVTRQIGGVLAEIPQNAANIRAKVQSLRQWSSGPLIRSFIRLADEIGQELEGPSGGRDAGVGGTRAGTKDEMRVDGKAVRLRMESTNWESLRAVLGSFLEMLAGLAFALVLLVFFLLGRDDIRDRIVMLAGRSRLTLTSKALEDIAHRVSRYIAAVALLNGGFAIVMTLGLLALQVPYALLWGFLAGTLRFIPYIGPWVGAAFPILMGLAVFDGWWPPVMVVGFVLVLELVSNNFIEPLVFGRNTGVSPTALIISAAFWAFLWGPIGLVLSAPIAVCLVVIGKHVPQWSFLNLLLGDTPALRAHVGLYQRLLLGDAAEVETAVRAHAESGTTVALFDELLIPALLCLRRDVRRGYLTESDERKVLEGLETVLQRRDGLQPEAVAAEIVAEPGGTGEVGTPPALARPPGRLLLCPATDAADALGVEMLRQALPPGQWECETVGVETLASELVGRLAAHPPDVVCIVSMPPGGLRHARYLCKRLHDAAPALFLIVGRWRPTHRDPWEQEALTQVGAGFIAATLRETLQALESRWLLRLSPESSVPSPRSTSGAAS